MSIVKFSSRIARRKVGFLGVVPTGADKIFEARHYECIGLVETARGHEFIERGETRSLDDKALWEFDCLVLLQDKDSDKHNNLVGALETFAPLLLPRDGRIYILPAFDIDLNRMTELKWHIISAIHAHEIPNSGLEEGRERFVKWDEEPKLPAFGPFAHIINHAHIINERPPYDWVGYDWVEIANIIRSNPASTAPPAVLPISAEKSNGVKIQLDVEKSCLLQRAFHDCASVDLVSVSNGLSGIGTYKTYAKLRNNLGGQSWPYVYFVKLGERKTIATEYRKYENNAMDHVPYHLGPRLRRDRCALGHKFGVIVTDYVHTAEALRDCARDGRAGAAIGNLFSHTLRNWRDSANEVKEYDIREHLTTVIEKKLPNHHPRNETINKFGATKSHEELREFLLRSESKPTLMGVIHNDLHATNVLVRANDAIIIDFEKLEGSGPLLFDVASLEAGLFVDGFIGDKREWFELRDSVAKLYTLKAFDWETPVIDIIDKSAWFFECVRLVRMHAREMQLANRQYALVLAAVFLKKSCNDKDFDKLDEVNEKTEGLTREQTRALSYLLAEKIILSLTESATSKEEK